MRGRQYRRGTRGPRLDAARLQGGPFDLLTDYYEPASWVGIATKADLVACVDVTRYTVTSYSGQPKERRVPNPEAPAVVAVGLARTLWRGLSTKPERSRRRITQIT